MSATLVTDKIEFSVFGKGYDDARGNSGDGMDTLFMWKCDYAAFDKTSRYLWITTKTGNTEDVRIHKIDTTTWEEVHHAFENVDCSLQNTDGLLTYVENDNSNYGVLVTTSSGLVIFDLTTDEVIYTIDGNLWTFEGYYPRATHVDNLIRIIGATMSPNYYRAPWAVVDTDTSSYILNEQSGGYTISSFYNDTNIVLSNRQHGDRQYIWGGTIESSGGLHQTWGLRDFITKATLDGFASNDYLFFPTQVGDIWQYGKYTVPPDLVTPSPITTFGLNANTLATPACYTRGRTWASFRTTDNALVVHSHQLH